MTFAVTIMHNTDNVSADTVMTVLDFGIINVLIIFKVFLEEKKEEERVK